jgi:hypothetical protein
LSSSAGTATPSRRAAAAARASSGPHARLAQALGQQARQFGGLPPKPGQRHRFPARDLNGYRIVLHRHVGDERETDPLSVNHERVVVDAHLDRHLTAPARERFGRADRAGRGGGGGREPVAEFGQQLGTHHAEAAQFDRAPVGAVDPDDERLGFGDGRDLPEGHPQHGTR